MFSDHSFFSDHSLFQYTHLFSLLIFQFIHIHSSIILYTFLVHSFLEFTHFSNSLLFGVYSFWSLLIFELHTFFSIYSFWDCCLFSNHGSNYQFLNKIHNFTPFCSCLGSFFTFTQFSIFGPPYPQPTQMINCTTYISNKSECRLGQQQKDKLSKASVENYIACLPKTLWPRGKTNVTTTLYWMLSNKTMD